MALEFPERCDDAREREDDELRLALEALKLLERRELATLPLGERPDRPGDERTLPPMDELPVDAARLYGLGLPDMLTSPMYRCCVEEAMLPGPGCGGWGGGGIPPRPLLLR